jgi:uncharacterized protein (TIRG00374 family)
LPWKTTWFDRCATRIVDSRRLTHKQKLHLLVGVGLAVGLLALFLRGIEWPELLAAFGRAKPAYLAAVVLVTIVVYVVRAWRWGYLLRPLAPVPFLPLLSATIVGFLSALVVPRAGEVLRPYLIARRHPVSTSSGFAIIILERLIDLMTVLSMLAAYLYLLPVPAQQVRGPSFELLQKAGLTAGVASVAILGMLFLFHAYPERVLALAARVFEHLPAKLGRPLLQLLRSFGEGLAVLKAPLPLLLAIVAQSYLLWLATAASFYYNNLAFGVDLPFHSTFLLIAFLTVGVAIPTPGAVGGFHAAYLLCLTEAFGVPQETSAAAGFAGHALANLPIVVFGLFFLGREGLTMGRVAELAQAEKAAP